MTYEKIQELKRNHLKKAQVARRLNIDQKTVAKYWDMPPDEYARTADQAKGRTKKPDQYKGYVVSCLQTYPDMSAAQLYDWIKDKAGITELPFRERCFRDYVRSVREEYGIQKPETDRQYEAVDDQDYGYQAQVDMGEIALETPSGRKKKVYGFAMVLSRSRFKYICWQSRPWTTADFVTAHIKTFSYFGGRPRQIVYDQDKVLAVSENHGDIIYTEGFQNYLQAMGFDIFLCRGADPESKGRIEAVIKYAKNGFAKHRIFVDDDSFNKECIVWLERTGTTKKIPAEVFAIEEEHLIPVSEYSFSKPSDPSITYSVRKDNVVLYKSNRYRVPLGTYKKGKQVHVIREAGDILIIDAVTGVLYARHPFCRGKGELIGESSRAHRDKSKTILEQEETVKKLFDHCDGIDGFLSAIHKEKRRYYRDQLGVIRYLFTEWDAELIKQALVYCIDHELYSAGDLKSACCYLSSVEHEKEHAASRGSVPLPEKYRGGSPPIRDLREYERAMERRAANG